MPPLICLSPQLLDQSFPRSDIELHVVADVLGDIDELREADLAHLVLPGTLALFVEEFCWSRPNPQGLLLDVYRHLAALFAQPRAGVVSVDVDCVSDWSAHPIPGGCEVDGLVGEWAEEVGRLLSRHDRSSSRSEYFIGVFVGSSAVGSATYDRNEVSVPTERCFPLVDACTLVDLEDAYTWDLPADYVDKVVKPRDVIAHYRALGCATLEPPDGDDHYHLIFADGTKWTFAQHWTEIGENAISQLKRITGLPPAVVKYALCEGKDPRTNLERHLRLDSCSGCQPCRGHRTRSK